MCTDITNDLQCMCRLALSGLQSVGLAKHKPTQICKGLQTDKAVNAENELPYCT